MRKGQNLSINTIIIFALALVVLVVLLGVFTGKIQVLSSASECPQRGGKCLDPDLQTCDYVIVGYRCAKSEEICCVNPEEIA